MNSTNIEEKIKEVVEFFRENNISIMINVEVKNGEARLKKGNRWFPCIMENCKCNNCNIYIGDELIFPAITNKKFEKKYKKKEVDI